MPNLRLLNIVFFTAVASSLVHYTDNYLAFDRFPQGGPGPDISDDAIWIAWVLLTALGVTGYVLYRRGEIRRGSALLAAYSVSGLIGLGHYTAPGIGDLAWWRHLHIWADILCGIAVLAFAIWSVQGTRSVAPSSSA